MFCRNCGAQNEEGAAVCASCGTPLKDTAPAAQKKKLPIPIIAGAAVVVVLLIAFLGMGRKTPKNVATNFLKAVFQADGKTVVSLVPEKVLETYYDDMSKSKYTKEITNSLEDLVDELDDNYDKWSVSVKVLDEEKITGDKLEDLVDHYDDRYDLKISAAEEITVKLTAKADGDTESEQLTLITIKAGGAWFLSLDSFFQAMDSLNYSF